MSHDAGTESPLAFELPARVVVASRADRRAA
jgi:hypothetical protein